MERFFNVLVFLSFNKKKKNIYVDSLIMHPSWTVRVPARNNKISPKNWAAQKELAMQIVILAYRSFLLDCLVRITVNLNITWLSTNEPPPPTWLATKVTSKVIPTNTLRINNYYTQNYSTSVSHRLNHFSNTHPLNWSEWMNK